MAKKYAEMNEAAGCDDTRVLAERLKRFRLARRYSLRRLGKLTGTSASFLSQIERGRCGASPSTLVQIAGALGISVSDLFAERSPGSHTVLKRSRRPGLPESGGCRKMLITQRPMHEFEVYIGDFDVSGSTGELLYAHGGVHELLVVLRGLVEVNLDTESFILEEGDSIEYAPSTPHRTVNIGAGRSEVMWIIAPSMTPVDDLERYLAWKPKGSPQ